MFVPLQLLVPKSISPRLREPGWCRPGPALRARFSSYWMDANLQLNSDLLMMRQ